MPVQLTKEETKFVLERGFSDNLNVIVALLWEYWSSTNIPLTDLFERSKQIRENGYLFERM